MTSIKVCSGFRHWSTVCFVFPMGFLCVFLFCFVFNCPFQAPELSVFNLEIHWWFMKQVPRKSYKFFVRYGIFFFFYPQSLRVAVLKVVSKAALRSLFTVLQLLCWLLLLWLSNKSLVPWKPLSCLLFSHFHLLPLKSYTVLLITSAWYCNLITH